MISYIIGTRNIQYLVITVFKIKLVLPCKGPPASINFKIIAKNILLQNNRSQIPQIFIISRHVLILLVKTEFKYKFIKSKDPDP